MIANSKGSESLATEETATAGRKLQKTPDSDSSLSPTYKLGLLTIWAACGILAD
jgi:hypothetical protein